MPPKRKPANTLSEPRDEQPIVLAITSDQHANSTVAVAPPILRLDDGPEIHHSKAQAWLYNRWGVFWERVGVVRKSLDAKLVIGWNGDASEGYHHRSTQVMSANSNAQGTIFNHLADYAFALNPDATLVVRGTEAHVGQSACFEEGIAKAWHERGRSIIPDEETGNYSHWHKVLDLRGILIDFAHHGRVGTRPWTKPNVTMNLAAEIFFDYAKHRRPHPHLAVRSHMHQYVDTGDAQPVRVLQTPAWQLKTAFIQRLSPHTLSDVGGLIITIAKKDGEWKPEVEPVVYRPDPSPVWRLEK